MEKLKGVELGILMDALLMAYRNKDNNLISNIRNKIASRLEGAAGLPFEEVEGFLRVLDRWIYVIISKEV
jgi:hypothetical protein